MQGQGAKRKSFMRRVHKKVLDRKAPHPNVIRQTEKQ